LPNRFVSNDETNPYYMHVAVQTYWKETLKHNKKKSTAKSALYDMAFLPEWKFSTLPVFLCFICLSQLALFLNFDDMLYSHKSPFQLDSAFSNILIFFIKVVNFSHFMTNAQYMDMWFWMPDYGPFITVEDFEFIFLGSSPSFWNFLYSSHSATSEEWKWLVSYRMFENAYGTQTDSYLLLKNWLGFVPREVFESTKNFKWRDYGDNSGATDLLPRNLTIFSSTIIRVWTHAFFFITLPIKHLTFPDFPIFCCIMIIPGIIFICIPFSFLINYFSYFSLARKDNFYLNYIKYLKKHQKNVNKK
jgi:hypothetical protein